MSKNAFFEGVRDGIPIALGYFAVAFSLGIAAQTAGLTAFQGFIASFFNVASAGEYALFKSIQSGVSYLEVAIITFIVNARYMLMSCALSQKINQQTNIIHRFFVAFGITDEIFGISIGRRGSLEPFYNYGAIAISVPLWSIGTSLGIIAGNILPANIVSALSIALYGMFLAIIIPAAKKYLIIKIAIIISFLTSYIFSILPHVKELAEGTRTIILTILISALLAFFKPVKDVNGNKESN
ncbi:MAG: AzlC family ABC transporter permease [Treponema sp.]|nr:AzlC family ABC transporter permease [Treponema sp.]